MTWAEGYPADTGYTYGYYRQLNPVFARTLLAVAGFAAPEIRTACELGFGQGVSVAMHAAASGADWWGTDFMPDQAEHARELAGPGAHLAEQSFAEFCARTDLPEFDLVCAHGIWSWVSPENRAVVADFLRRKLRPGGVFYVSHNTETGWGGLRPFRELLRLHVQTQSPAGLDRRGALRRAADFTERVFAAQSVYARQNPMAPAVLEKLQADESIYPVHEYLGAHWNPMNVAEVASELAGAKLGRACSAAAVDHVPGLSSLQREREALDGLADPALRETAAELLRGTRFRRDYWLKGGRRMGRAEHGEAVDALRFALVEPRRAVTVVRASTHAGEVELPVEAFGPVLDLLADHLPHRVGDLAAALRPQPRDEVLHLLLALVEAGAAQPAQADDAAIAAARPRVQALNARLLQRARHGATVGHLGNPVTGGATEVPHPQQLLLLAEREGVPEDRRIEHAAANGGTVPALREAAAHLAGGRREVLRVQGVT